jgi:NAD(P)-dependent dehydrogenase (short-subunit alcohol dehydrogenase family)
MDLVRLFPSDLFQGQTVFVTGGGSGVNLGVAKCFAALGANLAICGRTRSRLEDAAKELQDLGAKVHVVVADVRDYDLLRGAVSDTASVLGPIRVLVCGAAGDFLCRAEELSAARFKSVVEIDLFGTFHAASAAFSQLRQAGGCAIFISAGQSILPYALQAHAGAAKAGVDNLMRNLALEWGRYGIRVNSIIPGPIEGTEGMRRLAPGEVGRAIARHRVAAPAVQKVSVAGSTVSDSKALRRAAPARFRGSAERLSHQANPLNSGACDPRSGKPTDTNYTAGAGR